MCLNMSLCVSVSARRCITWFSHSLMSEFRGRVVGIFSAKVHLVWQAASSLEGSGVCG